MKPFRRSFTVRMPDGGERREALPRFGHLRIGALYSHPIVTGNCLIVQWFVLVKGGWIPKDSGGGVSASHLPKPPRRARRARKGAGAGARSPGT